MDDPKNPTPPTTGTDDDTQNPGQQGQVPVGTPPNVAGELSVSGSTPDPDSDDDTLVNAQNAGFQMDEDEEHPQEIDMARDIDKAEDDIRTH